MESLQESLPTVIQYYKGTEKNLNEAEAPTSESSDNLQTPITDFTEKLEETEKENVALDEPKEMENVENEKTEPSVKLEEEEVTGGEEAQKLEVKQECEETMVEKKEIKEEEEDTKKEMIEEVKMEMVEKIEENLIEKKEEVEVDNKVEVTKAEEPIPEKVPKKRGRKRKHPLPESNESLNDSGAKPALEPPAAEDNVESEPEEEDETEVRPRKRGRCKKNPDIIPSHLSSDIVLGYKILLKFLETPQFSGFHKPMAGAVAEDSQITCLNQIKRKFEENVYKRISEFVNDVREMLTNIYESRNTIATKRALRLEQILEQRIAQLPNYLRPQCALILSPDDLNNSHNKIRINKGGGFVSLLLEKAEKRRCEKDKEKRKLLAEERKQLKEEQDKDVQEWEKNVLLKDHEEEIKSMWELPAIGHFIHLCTDILNIGEVAQYEVERMLLMPQCSETLDLIMTALLSNSLVRAKLDRTPPMPYSIWSPLVTTRVVSWYRALHREGKNEQKVFEEIGVEPGFWQILGADVNPLDYYLFHELTLFQRVWILKTLCDVDFVRKKTVYDNIRAQTLDELNPVNLGVDRHGNRYIQLKQFCGPDMRIYRQCAHLEGDFSPSDLIESAEGFEYREGPITVDKVFKDIWDVGEKSEVKLKKKKSSKSKKVRVAPKLNNEIVEKKNLRQSARAKQRSYVLDSSDSDQSDTDLATLKSKLRRPDTESLYRPFSDKEFISLSVFRLPRDKVSTKPNTKRNSYVPKKYEECGSVDKCSKMENKKDSKVTGFEDEASDSLDLKQMQDMQIDFEKNFQMDDVNEDDFDLESKFTVKNLDNLKMVFKKGATPEEDPAAVNPGNALGREIGPVAVEQPNRMALFPSADKLDSSSCESSKIELSAPSIVSTCDNNTYKYNLPEHLKPDSSKFYLVVDSVEALRQLISKFASHENDLEIISRSTKSNKKNNQSSSSCEVQLIERLQNLLVELEPWEWDLIKSSRSNREKMYKEYMNFLNRPSDFVHPNEAYWMKLYEEPAPAAAANSTANAGANSNGATDAPSTSTASTDKSSAKEKGGLATEFPEASSSSLLDELAPRKRTRVTRLQLKLDEQDDLDDELGEDDAVESSESDDNWELPTSQRKKAKKEVTPRITRPKRPGRRSKGGLLEKLESQTVATEKPTQSSVPDKAKKALFWGPRSSDPSEDLNWETNRQKILEKHNSPKKVLFKGDDIADEMSELENALQNPRKVDNSVKTVITSPKRFIAPIPGNKKPYFSSAQLKAMEDQAKQQKKPEDIQFAHPKISKTYSGAKGGQAKVPNLTKTLGESSSELGSEVTVPTQTTSRLAQVDQHNNVANSNNTNSPGMNSSGNNNNNNNISNFNEKLHVNQQMTAGQSTGKTVPTSFTDPVGNIQTVITTVNQSGTSFQQPAKIIQHIKKPIGQIQPQLQKVEGQVQYQTVNQIQKIQPGTQLIQIQKPIGQIQEIQQQGNQQKQVIQQLHVQQPINQITQVQIPQSLSQIHPTFIQTNTKDGTVSLSNIRVHQPVQLQSPSVITVQQPVQLQNQTIQIQAPRVATIQQPVQVQATKVQQSVQASQSQSGKASDNDLYLTDGTVLIKADSNFVQQFMQKDKVLTLNVNEKLDFKKPLFIVKPKTDVNATANNAVNSNSFEPSTSQQNIIVFNKAPAVQQSAIPTSVTNIVIPTNYIVSNNSTVQSHIEPSQNLTVVQQNPTFIIRQKPLVNKVNQPQVIKIIDPQNMTANQNVILSPTNLKFTNQVIRPVSQSVITSEQSKPTPTLRFIRPQNVINTTQSVIQNKINTIQTPKGSVNNVVQVQQVQSPRLEVPKSQPSVITSKIIAAPVQNVRISTPGIQGQPVRAVVSAAGQPVRFATSNNAGIRLVNRFVRPPKTNVISSTASTPVTVVTNARPPAAMGQSIRLQNVNLQPSIIRTAQNRLQLTPTKLIARTNTPLTNPIIIKLEEQEDVRLAEEKAVTDQPLTVDYLQGELSVKETNQGWMYVVKASDGSDVILNSEPVEDSNAAANNDPMK